MVIPKDLDALESKLLNCEQIDCSLTHHFAPDVYIREGLMPKGALIIGHAHKRKHLNIMLKGEALVYTDGKVIKIKAPCTFLSGLGRKAFFIIEDTIFQNVFATSETNIDALEELLVDKSDLYLEKEASLIESKIEEAILCL
jgi:hypothetical protein